MKLNEIHSKEIMYKLPDDMPERYLKDGIFLFAAYGCAITERRTPSGIYVYTAVNLTTGKSVTISRRKNKLDKSGFETLAAKISALPIRNAGCFNIDKNPNEAAENPNKNSDLLKALNIIFTEILPEYGYTVREKQIELTEHILTVTGKRGITLAESEVGTGKTHAYLIATVLAKRGRINDSWLRGHYPRQSWADSAHMPIIISTSSIALQNAILTDYIPELSQILIQHGVINTPLTAVVRKGKDTIFVKSGFSGIMTA